MDNNILSQLKPSKILGKESEGVIILTHDSKYTVKIYISNYQKSLMFFNIIQYLQECKLPKTIYKSYLFTQKENSLDRYIENNKLLLNKNVFTSIRTRFPLNLKLKLKYLILIRYFERMNIFFKNNFKLFMPKISFS